MNFAKHWAATLDDFVIDLAWSPDGTLLAAASAAGPVTLFDSADGKVRHVLSGHADGTNCLAWLPAARAQAGIDLSPPSPSVTAAVPRSALSLPLTLATGGQDGCVRLWDAASGTQTAETKLGGAWVEHLAWESTGAPVLFAAAGRKLVALRPDGAIAHTFPDLPKTISALAVSPSLASGAPRSALSAPLACVAAACFGLVRTFDMAAFAAQKEYAYGNAIYALTWSPDGRWLVAGCHDNAVHLWAPAEDLELHMSGYETRLKELSFSHDSRWLATGGGRDACVWDCAGAGPEGREPMPLPHKARVCALAYQNSHSLLASGDQSGVFTLWAPTRKNPMFAEVSMPGAPTKFSWRGDDSLLAVGTEKGHVFTFKTA